MGYTTLEYLPMILLIEGDKQPTTLKHGNGLQSLTAEHIPREYTDPWSEYCFKVDLCLYEG